MFVFRPSCSLIHLHCYTKCYRQCDLTCLIVVYFSLREQENLLSCRLNTDRCLSNARFLFEALFHLGTLYTLDLFMRIKNNATRKAVKTIILTFRLASSNHYQLKNGRHHKPKLTMLLQ